MDLGIGHYTKNLILFISCGLVIKVGIQSQFITKNDLSYPFIPAIIALKLVFPLENKETL